VVRTSSTYTFTVTGPRALVANFELNSYAITATANPTEGGVVTGANTYNHFESCSLVAAVNEGYTFVGWTENGQVVSTSTTYNFTVTGPRALVANFELKSYNIVANAIPTMGGTITGGGMYHHFETCTLTAIEEEGYTFVNWTKDGQVVSTEMTYSFEVTGAANFFANFELNGYEITASANPTEGGTVTGGGLYYHFWNCTLTAIENEGYTFVNWTKDGEVVSTSATFSFKVSGAANYVANFTQNSYVITAVADLPEGGTITGTGSYLYGETCTLSIELVDEYKLINWTLDGQVVSEQESFSFVVTESANYVAHLLNTVGVAEQNEITVSLFPNPVKDRLTIEASEPIHSLEIYTINGALVYKQDNCSERVEINVDSYSIGTYMVRLTTDSSVEIRKFVKK